MSHIHRTSHIGRQPSLLPPVRVPAPALRAPRGWRLGVNTPVLRGRRSWISLATWFALAVAVLALLALQLGPRLGLYRVNVVLSGSMKPLWQAGDLVITTPHRPQDLRVGQVITFNPPIDGKPSVTHRIVELTHPGDHPMITTKGDANPTADPWGQVQLDAPTVWVVSRPIPKLGWALAFLQHRAVTIVTGLFVPLALLLTVLVQIWRPQPRVAQ